MRSLVVAPWVPFPPRFGSAVRTYHSLRMLAEFSDVSLLCYATDVKDAGPLADLCERVELVHAPRRDSALWRAASTVQAHSFQYLAAGSRTFQRALDDLSQEMSFDVVKFDMSLMARFQGPSGAVRIVDFHNLEAEVVARRVGFTDSRVRRAALAFEAKKLRAEEIEFCREADLALTTSDRETEIARGWNTGTRIETLVNTVDTERFRARTADDVPESPRLLFIGTLHYEPNRDALLYFTNEIFPHIRAAVPDVEFEIVGGGRPSDVVALDRLPGVRFTGFIDDVRDAFSRASAMVVPLRSGGGTRLKILEAMASGVAVVSTSIGAEGLTVGDGDQLAVADDPLEFAAQAVNLLQDREAAARLAVSGRQCVVEEYDWRSMTQGLETAVHDALEASHRRSTA